MALNFVSWNLEKRQELVNWALTQTPQFGDNVDVGLFQEYDTQSSRPVGYNIHEAVSFDTFGTAVYSRIRIKSQKEVASPHWDHRANLFKGLYVYKVTAIDTLDDRNLTVVSFHGFNGTRPLTPWNWRSSEMLMDHVHAVLAALPSSGPCVFAGDFNTWTDEHHQLVNEAMVREGFTKVLAVPYEESSEKTLDLVYCRGCKVTFPTNSHGRHLSDHPYMTFTVELD